jgi:hypothetical protein
VGIGSKGGDDSFICVISICLFSMIAALIVLDFRGIRGVWDRDDGFMETGTESSRISIESRREWCWKMEDWDRDVAWEF